MDEYIEREAVINDIGDLFTICYETLPNECGHHFIVEKELQTHLDFVRSLPAADVAPVRHGKWTAHDTGNGILSIDEDTCSLCGSRFYQIAETGCNWHYCPNCGAKMDLKADREAPETII